MLKALGMVCILAGSTGIGILCAAELDLRIRELEELEQRMLLLKGEIRYMHQPLPEAFLHLSAGAPPPFGDFFRPPPWQPRRRQTASAAPDSDPAY